MNVQILALAALSSALAFGQHDHASHADHDWRSDERAFKSARVEPRRVARPAFAAPAMTISATEMREKLEQLTGLRDVTIDGKVTRIPERGGATGRELARKWLADQYRALGFEVSQVSYGLGTNFVAEKHGSSDKVFVLSSHIDSVNNAGANDDGMGTIAALLIAENLARVQLKTSLRIVGFDQEELGLIGSKAYVKTLDTRTIVGDLHLEMMGYNSRKDGKFHVIDCDRADSKFITDAIMNQISAHALPLTRVSACTDRSDHSAFWNAHLPAIVISENFFGGDGDRCYHKPCDVVDGRLDFDYAARIASAAGGAVAGLVQ